MLATQMVHWPGKSTPACDEHTKQLQAASQVLGFTLTTTSILGMVECENCINERVAHERSGKSY